MARTFHPSLLKDPLRLATRFGVPTCILNWNDEILQLIPSLGLAGIDGILDDGVKDARNHIGTVLNNLLGKGNLKLFDSESGQFVFETSVGSSLKTGWTWPVQQVLKILHLVGDKVISFSDKGALQVSVDSGLAKYNYILPAQSK